MNVRSLFAALAFAVPLAGAVCGLSAPASADTLWNFSGDLDDGGMVTGTFTWTDSGYLSSADLSLFLQSTNGSNPGVPAATYTIPGSFPNGGVPPNAFDITNNFFQQLEITFQNPLTTPGIDNILVGLTSFECDAYTCPGIDTGNPGANTRFFVDGFATSKASSADATPLPSTWTMMLIGMAGLGFAAYRRQQKQNTSLVNA